MQRLWVMLLVGGILAGAAGVVSGTTINVPGDQATIQAGIDATVDGDTVLIAPGVYFENIRVSTAIVLASRFITDSALASVDSTIIDGSAASDTDSLGCVIRVYDGQGRVQIVGRTIRNGIGYQHPLVSGDNKRAGGAVFVGERPIRIAHCLVTGNRVSDAGGGICTWPGFSRDSLIVEWNVFHDNNAADSGGCISMELARVRITRNVFSHSWSNWGGALVVGVLMQRDTALIQNNVFWQTSAGPGLHGVSIGINGESAFHDIRNNIFAAGEADTIGEIGFDHFDNGPGIPIIPICTLNARSPGVIAHNSFYQYVLGTGNPSCVDEIGDTLMTTNADGIPSDAWFNIARDPHFTDTLSGPAGMFAIAGQLFRLMANSPCIDAGDPATPVDPDGTIADIGVFYRPESCDCPCHANPECDSVTNVFDVVLSVGVAFRNETPVRGATCPYDQTDVDCGDDTDVFDVVHLVAVAFRNADPAGEFCEPCGGL